MTPEDLRRECDACRQQQAEKINKIERRLTTLEVTLWGRGGENGLRGAINSLQRKMDTLLRFFWIASALPPVTVAIVLVLKFLGKL
jgi:hypothetical protein